MVLKSRSVLSQNLDEIGNQNDYSVDNLINKKGAHESNMRAIETKNWNNSITSQRIAIQMDDGLHLLPVNNIVRIESNHNYVFIHLFDNSSIFISSTLKEISENLSKGTFIRVHNSHVINLLHLNSIKKNSTHYAVINHTTKVPISRRRFPHLITKLKEWAVWV